MNKAGSVVIQMLVARLLLTNRSMNMQNKKKYVSLLSWPLLMVGVAQAAEPRFSLDVGYDFGGAEVGEVYFSEGTTAVVRANEGMNIAVGVALPLGGGLDLQTSIGLQWSEQSAENGSMTWQSVPWQTLLVANLGTLSVGGGVVYHFNPELETDGVLRSLGQVQFDDALGYQAQVAYAVTEGRRGSGFLVGARYTTIDFTAGDATIRGDAAAVFVKFLF